MGVMSALAIGLEDRDRSQVAEVTAPLYVRLSRVANERARNLRATIRAFAGQIMKRLASSSTAFMMTTPSSKFERNDIGLLQ